MAASAALAGAGDSPGSSSHSDEPQFALPLRYVKAPITEEAGECIPAAEAYLIALESLARCLCNHAFSSTARGRLRSWGARRPSSGARPLISRSMAKKTSMRLDRLSHDRRPGEPREIKELCLPYAQYAASMIRPRFRLAS